MKDGIYTGNTYEVRGKRIRIVSLFCKAGTMEIDRVVYDLSGKFYEMSGEKLLSMNPKMV